MSFIEGLLAFGELQSKDYLRFVRDLRPDATMVPDNYTYMDDPLCLS